MKCCTSYVYLGVVILENGSAASMLKAHVAKEKHLNHLIIFLCHNHDTKVFDAAFSSTILYGCESWLVGCVNEANGDYVHVSGSTTLGCEA